MGVPPVIIHLSRIFRSKPSSGVPPIEETPAGSEKSKKLLLPKSLKAGELLTVLPKHVKHKDLPWANMQIQASGNWTTHQRDELVKS